MMRIPRSKDFWAGVSFILIGGLAIYFGSHLRMGSSLRMGPGYFPMVAAGILIALGLITSVIGLSAEAARVEAGALRPALILLAVLTFAVLLMKFGIVLATVGMVVVASCATPALRPTQVAMLAVVLAAFAAIVFVMAFGLPVKVWPI